MPIMCKIIQFTSMVLGVNSLHEVITDTVGFQIAESAAKALPRDVNGTYHVIDQSFALVDFGGSEF